MNYTMECQKCKNNFPESEIEVSHDVPTYLFHGDRKERRKIADTLGRHNLCKKCHNIYEKTVFSVMIKEGDIETKRRMIKSAMSFAKRWFNDTST